VRNAVKHDLIPFAAKYIWWKPPEESIESPERVVAQVMNLGTFDDVNKVVKIVGDDFLRNVIRHAAVGWFSGRSWHYWRYRLGLANLNDVPEMRRRRVA
jgi:hypothetical protein